MTWLQLRSGSWAQVACPHITLPVRVGGGPGYRWKALGEPVLGLEKSREGLAVGKKNFGDARGANAKRASQRAALSLCCTPPSAASLTRLGMMSCRDS